MRIFKIILIIFISFTFLNNNLIASDNSKLINNLSKSGILMDRKVLSDLAVKEPEAFKALVEQARGS